MNKWLSLLLVQVLLLCFLPVQAMASDETGAISNYDVFKEWRYEQTGDGICITGYDGSNTDVVIPDSIEGIPVVRIEERAFWGAHFTSVMIPNSVTTIGKYAFRACTALKSVILPEGLTIIETGVFAYCSELSSVTIPDSVVTIGTRAFYFCESLTEITLPENLTTIKNGVFSCSGLKNVIIPDGVSTLDVSVFEYCVNLTDITLGAGLCSILGGQFDTCPDLCGVWVGESNPYYCSDEYGVVYNKTKTEVILAPRGLTGHYVIHEDVNSINDHAFHGCQALTGVTIPDGVVSIGESAFEACGELEEVIIPDSVTEIGNNAFSFCTNLTNIAIGAGVESFGGSMLYDCQSLIKICVDDDNPYYCSDEYGVLFNACKTELIKAPGALRGSYKIPDGVVTIADYAFWGCMELNDITFPDSVTGIGEFAFNGCTGLTYVAFPDGVTVLQESAFGDCTGLTGVLLPDDLDVIGPSVFSSCVSLTSITIPNSVVKIESTAFAYCSSLKEVVFGNSLSGIGNYAFADCTSLTSIDIPDSVTYLGDGAFMGCSNLAKVTLGDGLSAVSNFLFSDCVKLKNITFGDNIRSIGEVAFSSTGIVEISVPEGVTNIGARAFYDSVELREIIIPASVIRIDDGAFSNCGLRKVQFCGDAVHLYDDTFNNVTAQIHYPAGNETWTRDIMRNYGGRLSWYDSDGNVSIFNLSGANILLGSSLSMNFFIDKDYLSGSDYYAEITHYTQDETHTYVIPYAQWDERTKYMVVTLENLSAKQMVDQIAVRIYHDDGCSASQPWDDSVQDYAMRIFDQQDKKTKTLLVDMLNYGAAAQTYFKYNELDLANSWLSVEQLACGTQSANCCDQRVEGKNYYGSSLMLKSRIQLTMYFQNITIDMYAVVNYTDHYGNTEEYTVSGSEFARYNSNTYGVTIDTLAVADGNQLVTVIVCDADGNQVAMAQDSINGYLSRMMSGDSLFEAAAKFTTSAYEYFL